jgi:hypothetical protein
MVAWYALPKDGDEPLDILRVGEEAGVAGEYSARGRESDLTLQGDPSRLGSVSASVYIRVVGPY